MSSAEEELPKRDKIYDFILYPQCPGMMLLILAPRFVLDS